MTPISEVIYTDSDSFAWEALSIAVTAKKDMFDLKLSLLEDTENCI